jgi:DNA-binding GntR family transcriptional regulator
MTGTALFRAARSRSASPPRNARPSKSSIVYDALKRQIILGELAPGELLTELDLASRFDVSQGTMREALLLLQEDGLVLRHGHRGTQVSDCTVDEAVEMFRLRQSLEATGIARALRRPSATLDDDLNTLMAGMQEAAAAGDEMRLAALDRDFHRRLFWEADLPALAPILHRCLVHNHRFKISRTEGPRDLPGTAERHRPIIEAVARRDVATASAILRHHIATIVDFGPDVLPQAEQ